VIWVDSAAKYDAFLSYSWGADRTIAPVIQTVIQRFLCPWHKTRARTVFRDLSCLPAGSSLEAELCDRLDRSTHLMVLASEHARDSQGMDFEASYWFSRPRDGQVLIIVTVPNYETWDEIRERLLPDAIRKHLATQPLWVNLGDRRKEIIAAPASGKLHEILVEDLAQVLLRFYPTRDWGQLRGEERAQRRRTMALFAATAVTLFFLAAAAVVFALYAQRERKEAVAQARMAQARQLASKAQYLYVRPNELTVASLLAVESVRREPILENRSLVAALKNFAGRPRAVLGHRGKVQELAISPDGSWIATASGEKTARIWDAASGRERVQLEHPQPVTTLAIGPGAEWLATGSGEMVHIWDTATWHERTRLTTEDGISG
jgi:hypothetical protein